MTVDLEDGSYVTVPLAQQVYVAVAP